MDLKLLRLFTLGMRTEAECLSNPHFKPPPIARYFGPIRIVPSLVSTASTFASRERGRVCSERQVPLIVLNLGSFGPKRPSRLLKNHS